MHAAQSGDQQDLSAQDQMVNIVGFAGCTVITAALALQACSGNTNAAGDKT